MTDVFSIAFLVIIIVACIIGYIKGFLSLLLGFAKGLVAILLASLLCKPVGVVINNTGIGTGIVEKIETTLIDKDEKFGFVLTDDNKEVFINEALDQTLKDAKIPGVIRDYLKNLLVEKIDVINDMSVAEYIGKGISLFVCTIIAYVVVFFLLIIILSILQKILKNINKVPIVGLANRLLGLALGIIVSLVFIAIVCYIITFLISIPGDMSNWLINTLKLSDELSEESSFAKFMYEHNILKWIFNLIFS